jgi:hypothetical protein
MQNHAVRLKEIGRNNSTLELLGHMKRFVLIGAVLLVVIGMVLVPMRVRTASDVAKIRALRGQVGEFSSLARSIRARYSDIDEPKQIEAARLKLGLMDLTGTRLVRFNGEGMPYFYGYVAYDTNRQTVLRSEVDELW